MMINNKVRFILTDSNYSKNTETETTKNITKYTIPKNVRNVFNGNAEFPSENSCRNPPPKKKQL